MDHSIFGQHGPYLSIRGFFVICLLFSFAFGFAILSDLFISSVSTIQSTVIFYPMPGVILTLALLALMFLLVGILIVWITLEDRTAGGKKLLWRRLMAISTVFTIFLLLSFSILYLVNKRVTITSEGMRLDTLFSTKEVAWSSSVVETHNFVRATQLGPPFSPYPYAFITFRTQEGEIVHFDLRFIGQNQLLEQHIRQHIDFDPPLKDP